MMKIVSINNEKDIYGKTHETLEKIGVSVVRCVPSLFSALTAMKVARLCDKNNAGAIVASCLSDIFAAVSAAKICKTAKPKIIALIPPNQKPPKGIPTEVCQNVDVWIFPSQHAADAYTGELKRKKIIAPVSADFTLDAPLPYPTTNDNIILLWMGDITDRDRLQKVVNKLEELDGIFSLRICGTGKARDVMPVVKWSRSLKHKDKIRWLGEKFDPLVELQQCHATLKTATDPTEYDSAAAMAGREVLEVDEIENFIRQPRASLEKGMSFEEYAKKIKEIITQ